MSFVIDASVALAWCFDDESNDEALRLYDALESESAVVPAIWPLEVGNALLVGQRRKRITSGRVREALSMLAELPIEVQPPIAVDQVERLVSFGERYNLSVYDAGYLDLCIVSGCALATLDKHLTAAAKSAGVELRAS